MRSPLGQFIRTHARHLAELVLTGALVNLLGLGLPLFSMLVYDKAIGNEVHDTLWALACGTALLLFLELCLRWARVALIENMGARWDARLDERLLAGVLATPAARPLPVGQVLARHREVATTRDVLSSGFVLPLADLPFTLLFGVALYLVGGPLLLVPVGMGLLLVLVGMLLHGASRHRQRQANVLLATRVTHLSEVLAARESLGSAGAARAVLQRWRGPAAAGSRASAQARLWSAQAQQITIVGVTAATVLMLVAGVFLVESQALSVGGLISSVQLGSRLLGLMCGLAPVVTRWQDFTAALRGLGDTVDLHRAASQSGAEPLATSALATEGIRLEALEAAYPGQDRLALDALTLQLRPGSLVAVVGASGSGKSTLLRVLSGQLAHTKGSLSFASHLIDSDDQRRRLGATVAYKPQEPCFVGGTLAQVVAPGEDAPDEQRLVAALRAAGLGPVLERGELGLDSAVGTNGAGLSGGQRQMVALARLLYGTPDVVLLDEPTLGLDRTAQEELLRQLQVLKATHCVVVATHTAELIQAADRVLVLNRGKLVADSTPSRLMPDMPAPSATPATAAAAAAAAPTRGVTPQAPALAL